MTRNQRQIAVKTAISELSDLGKHEYEQYTRALHSGASQAAREIEDRLTAINGALNFLGDLANRYK